MSAVSVPHDVHNIGFRSFPSSLLMLPLLRRLGLPLPSTAHDRALALDDDAETAEPLLDSPISRPGHRRGTRMFPVVRVLVLVSATVLLGLLAALLLLPHRPGPRVVDRSSASFVAAARESIAYLRDRQSSTLTQASARYRLRSGRPPPQNYDKWFTFAQERGCLIDEYDQIRRDFQPFYQLAEEDPGFFQRMIDSATKMNNDKKDLGRYDIRNGGVGEAPGTSNAYSYYWLETLGKFSHILPDLTVVINARDQPRVVFDVRQPGPYIRQRARKLTENDPFNVSPERTQTYFAGKPGCTILRSPDGFPDIANDDSA
ncbi:CAP10 domain-containing protein [Mycena indigotica]|uniref:CAP10 domain-containing protein n=1 Tax=Mycena indigotica TaxID=2126181 RepID=A0A8H6W5D3_9AGAR|nr:CAP10 domain-containing protein [Mycena indigotica]KAF7303466.1 CAP10 domain-containing protein [Mycena indigotica]